MHNQIARFLASLPDESWLERLTTESQINLWHRARFIQGAIAQEWLATHTSEPSSIKQMVKDGRLTKDMARLIDCLVEYLDAIWQLCDYGYLGLKRLINDSEIFTVESPFDLFRAIVREMLDTLLDEYRLSYFYFTPHSTEKKLVRLLSAADGGQLKPRQAKELERFKVDVGLHKLRWQLILLGYAEEYGKTDKILRSRTLSVQESGREMVTTLIKIAGKYFVVEMLNCKLYQHPSTPNLT